MNKEKIKALKQRYEEEIQTLENDAQKNWFQSIEGNYGVAKIFYNKIEVYRKVVQDLENILK